MTGQRLQGLGVERGGAFGPGRHRALVQTSLLVRNHQIGVEGELQAEAIAGGAGPGRVVERKQARLDFRDREPGHRAGELLRKDQPAGLTFAFGWLSPLSHRDPFGQAQGGLQAIGIAAFQADARHQPVDDHIDVVFEVLLERGRIFDGIEDAVDLEPLVAGFLPVGDLLAVLALAIANHRRQQIDPLALGQGGQFVHHLADGLADDREAGGGRVGDADTRPQQAHVVVDFGDRADGGARIAAGGLLLDGDRWRQAFDEVHVRLAHQLEELTRIGRQALNIAPLALGVDGVEGETALARARKAGEHNQLAARDIHADVLQIVLPRATHANESALFEHLTFERAAGSASI